MDWETFWKISPTIMSFCVLAVGFVYTSGRLKEKFSNMVTKEELLVHCKVSQKECVSGVGEKVDELKILVTELHDKQSTRIEEMDVKREGAKEDTNQEMKAINKAIGRIEGHVEYMRNGN